uniref:CTCK domain-containing protein n=1 Tax=Sander lucioperca TaxID=283035 RepID=A0A8C9X529_SANLU
LKYKFSGILLNFSPIYLLALFPFRSPSFLSSLSYSTKTRSLQHTCSCCQELATSERQVQLSCPDNTEITYTYTHIDSCGCLKTECSVPGHRELATTPPSIKSRRRRR